MIRDLDGTTMVSGQIQPSEVAALKGSGVTMIVNNRPDGEEPGQPSSAEIGEAAKQAGIAYRHVPILRGIGPADVEQMAEALEAADGKVFAFCRSGNRSTLAWAVARRAQGAPVEDVEQCAERAGVELTPVAHLL